ncbi:MAG: 4Fe-4S binding protein [Acidilobaceae archaeon]
MTKANPSIIIVPVKDRIPFNLKKVLKPVGKPIVQVEWCKGCGFCIEFCPIGVLEFSDSVNAWGYQYPRVKVGMEDSCVNCGMCERVCPELAIHVVEESSQSYKVEWIG